MFRSRLVCLILLISLPTLLASIVKPVVISVSPLSFDASTKGVFWTKSPQEAQTLARKLKEQEQRPIIISLLPGVHELETTLNFGVEDSGVTWQASNPELPSVISGGRNVTGWVSCLDPSHPNVLCADITTSVQQAQPRHLYINGERVLRAKASNEVLAFFSKPLAVDDQKYVVPPSATLEDWISQSSQNIGAIEFVYSAPQVAPWSESRCTVDHIELNSDGNYSVFMKQPCFASLQHKPCGQSTFKPTSIENTGIQDLQAGQWFLDRSAGKVVVKYLPASGFDLNRSHVVMPVLEQLCNGTSHNVTFKNIIWEQATWSRANSGLGYIEQQSGALVSKPGTSCIDSEWEPMPGNVAFVASTGIQFSDCTFRHLGAAALQFSGGAQNCIVTGSTFYDVSGTAVQIGSYNTAGERNPILQENNNSVTNSKIELVGNEYHGNAGMSVGYAIGTLLSHNEIFNLTYTGISIGWGWARHNESYAANNTVSFNHIHDFKLQETAAALGDGGGIYALGPQPGSVMNGNWVDRMGSGRGGGGYYPDEGSAFWEIRDNVFSNASFCLDDCEWLHIWTSSIHDIQVKNCFTDTSTMENHGTNTRVDGITLVKDGSWPPEAQKIMQDAGLVNMQQDPLQASHSQLASIFI